VLVVHRVNSKKGRTMRTRWHIMEQEPDTVEQLQRKLGCTSVFARILANRNFSGPEQVHPYLNPSLAQLRSPFNVKDMDTAVIRISTALNKNEKILIFGDYDVDGVSATTLVYQFLKQAGANVCTHIPHRVEEGYGLQQFHIDTCIKPQNVDLLITVDCGSSNHEAIARARAGGVDVVVTDHHSITDVPVDAIAVVNPKRADCPAGFDHLAGVGVAFMLLICLRKHLRESGYWDSKPEPNLKLYCDLVALGTIADSVPLIDENRVLTRTGLHLMQQGGQRPGLDELFKLVNIEAGKVSEEDLAYRVVPRLNAAGRMAHAATAQQLLMAADATEARPLAKNLHELNSNRKSTEDDMLRQIRKRLHSQPELLLQNSLVLAQAHWHEGVIGIVAARLTEQFHRPVVVISVREDIGKGSARSIPGIDLYRALQGCADSLVGFGGHAMAAGLRVKAENIKAFRRQFDEICGRDLAPETKSPVLTIDTVVQFDQISDLLITEIETLKPFGQQNREPVLMAENITVVRSRVVGDRHLQLWLKQTGRGRGRTFQAIQFNTDMDPPGPQVEIGSMAFRVQWNYWNGRKNAQLVVEDVRM